MINLAISLAVMLVVAALPKITLEVSLWLSVPFGLLAGGIVFVLLARKVQEKVQVIMEAVGKEVSDGKLDRAITILKSGFALKNQMFFLGAQLHGQIGMLYYHKKDHDSALEHLKQGHFKDPMGQGALAAIYYKRKDYDNVKKTMDTSLKANGKDALSYALYAWFLCQLKEKDAAIAILQKGLDKLPKDERLRANLTQLQNNKKLKMKLFGNHWAQFMLERPPRVMQQQGGPAHMRMSKKAMFR